MIYSAILNSYTIIADYSEERGDYGNTLIKILKANRQPLEFYMINYLNFECFFLHKDEFTFSSIVQQNLDNEQVLIFLQTLKTQFMNICVKEKDNLTLKTTNIIRNLMISHSGNFKIDKFEKIENTLDDIKREKIDLVEKILEKDVILETVLTKSNNLKRQSFNMKTNFDKKLKKSSNSSKITFYLLIFLVIMLCLFFIYWMMNYNINFISKK